VIGDKYGDDGRLQAASSHYDIVSRPDSAPTSDNSQPPSAGSPASPVHPPAATDFGAVSLDEAWRTLTTSSKPSNGKHLRH